MKHDTPHRPDDELDDLFRRAAGAYEPPFDPKAWKQMQQKLDGGTRPLVRRLYLFGLVELLFVLAVLLFAWNETGTATVGEPETERVAGTDAGPESTAGTPRRTEAASATGRLNAVPESRSSAEAEVPTGTPTRPEAESTREKTGNAAEVAESKPGGTARTQRVPNRAASERIARNQPEIERAVPTAPTRRSSAKMNRSVNDFRTEKTFSGERVASRRDQQNLWRTSEGPERRRVRRATDAAAVPPVPVSARSESTVPEGVSTISVEKLGLRSPRWPRFAGTLPAVNAPAVPPRVDPMKPRLARWSGLVFAAPDFTNVPGRAIGSTGYNLGAQLEFRPLRRLRLGLGANYATKLYDASSYDYSPYPGYWKNYRPNRVTADCRILELPLSLRYDVLQRARSTWSVAVGSSSYLMLNENYVYEYPRHRDSHEFARSGNHWLATLNFAVGYERTMSQRLALRVEPFVKVPQGGVGFGHVRLRTAGVAVGLRYDFPRR